MGGLIGLQSQDMVGMMLSCCECALFTVIALVYLNFVIA